MKLNRVNKSGLHLLKIVALSLFMPLTVYADNKPVQVTLITDSNYKPYSYMENGKLSGITVDLIKKVDEALPHYDIQLQPMSWQDGLRKVRDGETLGIVGTYYSGPHRPWLYPYSQPLLSEQVVVICRPDVQLATPVIWPDSFAGLLVLNIAGYDGWLDFDIRNKRNTQLINFLEVPSISTAYKMLKSSNADCSLTEKAYVEMTIANETDKTEYIPKVVTDVSSNSVHLGFSFKAIESGKYPFAYEFARAFDIALYTVQNSKKQ